MKGAKTIKDAYRDTYYSTVENEMSRKATIQYTSKLSCCIVILLHEIIQAKVEIVYHRHNNLLIKYVIG